MLIFTCELFKGGVDVKKKTLVAVLIVLSILVVGVVGFFIRYEYYHGGSPSGKGWYAEETVEDNGKFVLKTNLMEADGIEMMSFYIENKKGEIIFDSEGGWRTWDLRGIYFADDGNDIIVDTGDVGKILFEYDDETWICEDDNFKEAVSVEQTLPWENWH